MNKDNLSRDSLDYSPISDESSIYFSDLVRGIAKFWWVAVVLLLVFGSVAVGLTKILYTPEYTSSATFTVQTMNEDSSYEFLYTKTIASELSDTFPYILQTNILQDAIREDIGLEDKSFPATLSATCISDTSMITLKSVSNDAKMSFEIINSAIENFPSVAWYSVGDSKISILSQPEYPEHPSNTPNYKNVFVRWGILGFVFGIVWLIVYAFFRETIRTKSDIKNRLDCDCLSVLPMVSFKRYSNNRVVIKNDSVGKGFLESMRVFRNTLIHKMPEGAKIISVSSTAPGEGKTTVVVNLAMSLAEAGKTVAVIDGDLRNPSVCNAIGQKIVFENHTDKFKKVFNEEIGFTAYQFNPNNKKLWKMISTSNMKKFLDSIRDYYDYIIMDTPPIGLISDALIAARVSDALIYVIMQDTIRVSRIRNSLGYFLDYDAKLLGCVLNGAASGVGAYGENYGYGYGSYRVYGRYAKYGYNYYGYSDKRK